MHSQVSLDGRIGSIDFHNGIGEVSFRDDDRVNVSFYKKSVIDEVRSRELGRPHYVAKDYVRIQQPGERDYADRPVADDPRVKARWPRQWALYQSNQEQIPAGSPLALLFPNQPEMVDNMRAVKVHTVEQLAHLTAEGLSQVGMGATQWQQKAKEFLAEAKAGVPLLKLQQMLDERDNKLEVAQQQMALMRQQIDQLMAKAQGVPDAMIPAPLPTQAGLNAAQQAQRLDDAALPYDDAAAEAEFAEGTETAPISSPDPIPRRGPGRPRKTSE